MRDYVGHTFDGIGTIERQGLAPNSGVPGTTYTHLLELTTTHNSNVYGCAHMDCGGFVSEYLGVVRDHLAKEHPSKEGQSANHVGRRAIKNLRQTEEDVEYLAKLATRNGRRLAKAQIDLRHITHERDRLKHELEVITQERDLLARELHAKQKKKGK